MTCCMYQGTIISKGLLPLMFVCRSVHDGEKGEKEGRSLGCSRIGQYKRGKRTTNCSLSVVAEFFTCYCVHWICV